MEREGTRGNRQMHVESMMIYPVANVDSILDVILTHLAFAYVSIVKQWLAIVNTSKECYTKELGISISTLFIASCY